jgi:hypothetical protein
MDVPENLTGNLTENPIKIHKNSPKSSKGEICESNDGEDVNPFEVTGSQKVEAIRPVGFGPTTYGLEIYHHFL